MNAALSVPAAHPVTDIPPVIEEQLTEIERVDLIARIKAKMTEQNAVLVAHYYTSADLQLGNPG